MNRIILALILSIRSVALFSQDSTLAKPKGEFSINGSTDIYYQWTDHRSVEPERPPFVYNFKKNNVLSNNLAIMRSSYAVKKWKASLGIMTGDYSKYNLAAEKGFFRHIYEANISYRFSPKTGIEAGILPSHIGFETAIAKENWNLSRTVLAENSPYYETGLKFNYSISGNLKLSFLALNGWQHIRDDNHYISFGTQAQVKLSAKTSLNSSTFFGREGPDSNSKFRAFHNFYLTWEKDPKNNIAVLFDIGFQQTERTKYANWWGAALLYQHRFCPVLQAAARLEYYRDSKGSVISEYQLRGLSLFSYALNFDYVRFKWFSLRLESRYMQAGWPIFADIYQSTRKNWSLLFCSSFYF